MFLNLFLFCLLYINATDICINRPSGNKATILNNRIAIGNEIWNTETKKIISTTPNAASFTLNSIFSSAGINTNIYSTDAQFIAQIPGNNYRYNPTSDYLWSYSNNRFTAYSDNGQKITDFGLTADSICPYSDEIRYNRTNMIYKCSFSDNLENFVGSFVGTFKSWFLGGQYFLTTQGSIIRIYDNNSVFVKMLESTTTTMGGSGSYFWLGLDSLNLYQLNSGVVCKYSIANSTIFPSNKRISIISSVATDSFNVSVINLEESAPSSIKYKIAGKNSSNYYSDQSGNWATTDGLGNVNCGKLPSIQSNILRQNLGKIKTYYANNNGYCVVLTMFETALVFHFNGEVVDKIDTIKINNGIGTIDLSINSCQIKLTSDGKYLAYGNARCLFVYEVASGKLIRRWSYNDNNELLNFDLSNDDSKIIKTLQNYQGITTNIQSSLQSSDSTWIGVSGDANPTFSPSGKYLTLTSAYSNGGILKIYKDGIIFNSIASNYTTAGGWVTNSGWFNDGSIAIFDHYWVVHGVNDYYQVAVPSVVNIDGQINTELKIKSGRIDIISDTEFLTGGTQVTSISGDILYKLPQNYSAYPFPLGSDLLVQVNNSSDSLKIFNWRKSMITPNEIKNIYTPYINNLGQNSPNPFRLTTSIPYSIPNMGDGIIKIFSSTGQLILSSPVSGEGIFHWVASEQNSGLYIYQLYTKDRILSNKMLLLK
jgi:hypothetical protein